MSRVPHYLIDLARELRKNATSVEEIMWACARNRQLLGAKFRRQHPVGRYIVDFCCLHPRLIVEVDGSIHAMQAGYDRERQLDAHALGAQPSMKTDGHGRRPARAIFKSDLEARHFTVLRFTKDRVEQAPEAVAEAIANYPQVFSSPSPTAVYPLELTTLSVGEGARGEG
jgi:very-short-patch-repair endonuclease